MNKNIKSAKIPLKKFGNIKEYADVYGFYPEIEEVQIIKTVVYTPKSKEEKDTVIHGDIPKNLKDLINFIKFKKDIYEFIEGSLNWNHNKENPQIAFRVIQK